MERIAFIRLVVERQVFAVMSTAARDVGLVGIMIVHSIVTGVSHILVKKQKGHHLYAIHAAKRIRKHTSVTKRIYDAFNRREGDGIWVINPALSSNDALEDGDTFGYASRDIHAKVYFTDKYNEPKRLYLGSLNASNNAFDHNVEFLLELVYKLDLYILVKDFGILDEEIRRMEMCDFVITPLFKKFLAEDESIRSKSDPLKTAYNKKSKVMRVLAELNGRISMDDVEGCLTLYIQKLWEQVKTE